MILSVIAATPPIWLVIPFVSLLVMIATGPVLFADFWHHHYKKISIVLGLLVGGYYLSFLHNSFMPIETLFEYFSFISILTILYVASGGIYIFLDIESKPISNILFLAFAALVTNFIGTTGASVLLIRPFMRLNRYRLKPYHIVFFIFIVSNVGGSLTPIGDPPLFMGFLKGVPFHWTITHIWKHWLLAISFLLAIFYLFERKNSELDEVDSNVRYTNKIIISGKRNLFWLFLAVVSVFLDPNIIDGIPYIDLHGKKISYLREIVQLSAAALCFYFSNAKALESNSFNFEPIKEVAFLFFGIFLCMMPALQLLEYFAQNQGASLTLNPSLIYWSSGIFSSVLDNAPTYLNVFTLLMSKASLSISEIQDVKDFVASPNFTQLIALSVGSVFFGAMTYIGNGPNFMVKAIAEHNGVKMPSFGKYISKFSLPILLPVLILIWLVFFI
jgi:Na+/H+ antiporter NhaD/arsenite permease-like protein